MPRRHPTYWASSQRSHTFSSTPCYGAWTSAPLSAHLSTGWECKASQIETAICIRRPPHDNSSVHLRTTDVWRSGRITDGMRSCWRTLRYSILSSPTSAPPSWNGPTKSSMGPQGRRRAGTWRGHFPLCLFKRGAAGVEVPFPNSTIGNSMVYQDRSETNLLQLFAHPENSQWFSIFSVFVFEVIVVAELKLSTSFCFF